MIGNMVASRCHKFRNSLFHDLEWKVGVISDMYWSWWWSFFFLDKCSEWWIIGEIDLHLQDPDWTSSFLFSCCFRGADISNVLVIWGFWTLVHDAESIYDWLINGLCDEVSMKDSILHWCSHHVVYRSKDKSTWSCSKGYAVHCFDLYLVVCWYYSSPN